MRRRSSEPNVNSGWIVIIDSEFGRMWTSKLNPNDIFVKRILFSKRALKKINKDPERVFKTCPYARYMEREWGVTKFAQGMKECRFKRFLTD